MMKPHRGAVILAFGILGFVVCQLFGIAAWVMADNDLKEMRRGYMDPSGRDLTMVGRILGMVATALMAIPVVLLIFFLVVAIVSH
ncbi:MAG TPA: hypothetical protein DC054_24550 [Blastocatellia bacterium]|jgi:hypothetical protein|nr:hypothetical protein [Blastocatellia bacterium]